MKQIIKKIAFPNREVEIELPEPIEVEEGENSNDIIMKLIAKWSETRESLIALSKGKKN